LSNKILSLEVSFVISRGKDVKTTEIYTHIIKGMGVKSPADNL